ncbi:MAG: NADP-dependent oxidoreductase [Reyranella sp.]|uniref:NADP-dependent oxidoreductase n=1 Tax=Reyranella sp. TaxID=1929291 RepID=UPI00121FDDA3|nr:NADP-dependent oxidoreductase [Reyranella sp.]TAJ95548.1 MAG: NADP-dependent oxidoreductase [Reyranella sp.]TBR28163.1 MAG: NADP-dependent oxidoreductase [Reyranella sp.]
MKTRAWTLIGRPVGLPTRDLFALGEFDLAPLADGEIRVRNLWLTVGPAMRVRMSAESRGYLPPYDLATPLSGWAIGEVVHSRCGKWAIGDLAVHQYGLRDVGQGPSTEFEKIPIPGPDPEHYLNALGSTGYTAYVGLVEIGKPRPGDTLFVSGAAGAVGSTAIQIGKALGLNVIGSAGGEAKCRLLRELGADVAIDYKTPGLLVDKLAAAAPGGIDIYLDNVGGEHLDAALALANPHARFAISGMISSYNQERASDTMHHLNRIVTQRIRVEGYLPFTDHLDGLSRYRDQMWSWIQAGTFRPWQTVREGLDCVPQVVEDLFAGRFTGKPLIRL